jgi:hypothetical protein
VFALLEDIRDRRGLKQEWDRIDVDVRAEIIHDWRVLIRKELAVPLPAVPLAEPPSADLRVPDGVPQGGEPAAAAVREMRAYADGQRGSLSKEQLREWANLLESPGGEPRQAAVRGEADAALAELKAAYDAMSAGTAVGWLRLFNAIQAVDASYRRAVEPPSVPSGALAELLKALATDMHLMGASHYPSQCGQRLIQFARRLDAALRGPEGA